MNRIGKFEYPDRGSFKEAETIAREALEKYGGFIPYDAAAQKLGYNVKSSAGISGWIYKKFDDVCMFGLMTRERKGLRTSDLAMKALDPTNPTVASEGKAEALRKISIIAQAYERWGGELPSETAFPAEITKITGVAWVEAQKHAEPLRKLFSETFPYLKQAPATPIIGPVVEDKTKETELGTMTISAKAKDFTFTKTLPFNPVGIESARKLLEFLAGQVEKERGGNEKETGRPK